MRRLTELLEIGSRCSRTRLLTLSPEQRAGYVIIVQDAFTTFYEPQIVLAAYDLIRKLGCTPLVLPFFANGKALVIEGFLWAFKALAQMNAEQLNRMAVLSIPMLGLEPAVTLTYRDEYPEILGTGRVNFRVQLVQEWLDTQTVRLTELSSKSGNTERRTMTLFGHCTEKTMAPAAEQAWERVFEAVGVTLRIPNVGCCGMCGVFGHEAAHFEESRGVYGNYLTTSGCMPEVDLRMLALLGLSARTQPDTGGTETNCSKGSFLAIKQMI